MPENSCVRTGGADRCSFPEDGTVYFKADADALRQRSSRSSTASFESATYFARRRTMPSVAANAWLVLLHNSRLGEIHPQSTVRNAFGDRYVYSLCPSAPEAREYAVALCKDVTDNYPVMGISLETPGFLPYAHGYHHEFAMMKPNRWLDSRLGLCFCDHCVEQRAAAGIDARRLADDGARGHRELPRRRRRFSRRYGRSVLAEPTSQPTARSRAFLNWRCDVVTSLVREIRAAVRADATVAIIPSVARPTGGAWYEGSDLRALAQTTGIIEACFYEPSVERVRAEHPRRAAPARRERESCAASSAPAFRICRAAPNWSPPRRRCATPAFPRSRSTTTVTCAAAILPGSQTRSPCSEIDRGVQQQSRRHHWRFGRHRSGALQAFRRTGRRDRRLDRSEAVTDIRRSGSGARGSHRGGRRRHRRTGSGGRPRSRGLPRLLGPIDILINNAGVSSNPSLERTTPEGFRDDVNANLNGAYNCAHAVLPDMKARRSGAIVNIGSVNGLAALGDAAYSAGKAGLISLTQALALEFGRYNIRANIVCPGTVRTPLWNERAARNPEVLTQLDALVSARPHRRADRGHARRRVSRLRRGIGDYRRGASGRLRADGRQHRHGARTDAGGPVTGRDAVH